MGADERAEWERVVRAWAKDDDDVSLSNTSTATASAIEEDVYVASDVAAISEQQVELEAALAFLAPRLPVRSGWFRSSAGGCVTGTELVALLRAGHCSSHEAAVRLCKALLSAELIVGADAEAPSTIFLLGSSYRTTAPVAPNVLNTMPPYVGPRLSVAQIAVEVEGLWRDVLRRNRTGGLFDLGALGRCTAYRSLLERLRALSVATQLQALAMDAQKTALLLNIYNILSLHGLYVTLRF